VPRQDRALTSRELNRAVLARQLLLDRRRLSLPQTLERMGCLQDQYAPSGYIGLWTRVEGFEREQLTQALERRTVVQAMTMRNTIHLCSRRDYWPLIIGIRNERKAWSRSVQGATDRELERSSKRLREALADGPLRLEDLKKLGPRVWRPGSAIWVDLVRIPPSGTWERRRADLYGLAEDWVGPEPQLPEVEARKVLVRRYLGAFGPAPRADVANWGGVRTGALAEAFDGLELRSFRDERGTELLDLPRAPLPEADTPAPVRFLPKWDATLLAHARRAGILAEEHRARLFHIRNPQSESPFLVDGSVAGIWRYADGRIELEPFVRISREDGRALKEESERLAAFHA